MSWHARIVTLLIVLAQPLLGWTMQRDWCACEPNACAVKALAKAPVADACCEIPADDQAGCCCMSASSSPDAGQCSDACEFKCVLCQCTPEDPGSSTPTAPSRHENTDSAPKFFGAPPVLASVTFDPSPTLCQHALTSGADSHPKSVSQRLAELCVWTI